MKEYKTFMEGKVLEKRRNVVNHRTTEYQYGSAVRKLQSVPEIHTYGQVDSLAENLYFELMDYQKRKYIILMKQG